jgi:hypothetical protein
MREGACCLGRAAKEVFSAFFKRRFSTACVSRSSSAKPVGSATSLLLLSDLAGRPFPAATILTTGFSVADGRGGAAPPGRADQGLLPPATPVADGARRDSPGAAAGM